MEPDFDRFVADSAPALLRAGYLIVWDLQDAEDLVQETFVKLAKRWPRVRSMEHQVAYARRILLNLALDGSTKRARRRDELAGELPDVRVAPDAESAVDTQDELVRALATLPPRQRAVLVLRYFLDLPEAEVAEALQCSLGTVKSTASRGLARLQETLRPIPQPRSIPT
ncbi:MAG TPA: SigE family RNA polymerase sigma factor [Solirubrobacteraceae bacterium]|jgi:RNA polymerase sigma-70 factor (sigma-E family)|nr:SigE family RNA polymerase sigma factor [Solirubrobacteraceae bacterium]